MVAGAETPWATGPKLAERLGSPIDIQWSENPLRPALRGLARVQRVAVLIDRRVDPDQRLEIKLSGVPLAEAFRQIAASRGLGVAFVGPVVYLGPTEAAGRARTLAALRIEDARRLPAATRLPLLRARPLAWDDFATPREILARWAEEAGVEIEGLARVPHDLWAAADGPPLPWTDRLTLVALQFDLTFTIAPGGRKIELAPVPTDLAVEALKVEPTVKAPSKKPASPGSRVVIGRFAVQEKPLGKVLEQFAGKMQLELHVDVAAIEAAGISLDRHVTATVENATVDDVLRALLRDTGLTYKRRGNVIEIGPK